MGKKRIIKKSDKELLEEKEQIEQKLKKEIAFTPSGKFKRGKIFISSTYNNTIITLANEKGDVLFWRSAGRILSA